MYLILATGNTGPLMVRDQMDSSTYHKVADLMKEVLPVDPRLNAATIRNHVGRIARQVEAAVEDKRPFD